MLLEDRKIWWVASYPKSGNTWIRMFVNAYLSGFPVDINSAFQYVIGDQNYQMYQMCAIVPVNQMSATEQFMLRPATIIAALSLCACKHVCMKTHHAKVSVDTVPLIHPKLTEKAVYIIRDPRDVAISFADHLGESIDHTIDCMNNMKYVNEHKITKLIHVILTWSMHVESWIEKNEEIPVTVVRYEDMVDDPDKAFRKILAGLGYSKINEEKFAFALKETTFSNLEKLEKTNGFREKGIGGKFFRVGKAGQWKTKLTSEQIQKIEEDHGEVMTKYGYELSMVPV